jgi:cyanophycin synthetase
LRERASDEVPRIQARALRAAGVPESAISIIPDEQEAIEAALRMGEPGDLVLIFADALVRSWKQITKFKPSSAQSARSVAHSAAPTLRAKTSADVERSAREPTGNGSGVAGLEHGSSATAQATPLDFSFEGLIRDERGVRMAPESDD